MLLTGTKITVFYIDISALVTCYYRLSKPASNSSVRNGRSQSNVFDRLSTSTGTGSAGAADKNGSVRGSRRSLLADSAANTANPGSASGQEKRSSSAGTAFLSSLLSDGIIDANGTSLSVLFNVCNSGGLGLWKKVEQKLCSLCYFLEQNCTAKGT